MTGRETLEAIKREHFPCDHNCEHEFRLWKSHCCCGAGWPCQQSLLAAALEEALARMDCSGGHCGEQCHVCDDRDAVLDKLTAGEEQAPKCWCGATKWNATPELEEGNPIPHAPNCPAASSVEEPGK